jgi:hypothetical protein
MRDPEEIRDRHRYARDRDPLGRPANARPRDQYGRPLPRGSADEMPDREDPEEVATSITDALERGVRLFDEQRFFEAHEFFEYVWHHDGVAGDAEFWKGVTQVAVGYCHVQRGNEAGARTLLSRASARLERAPARHRGVDAAALAAAARTVAAALDAQGAAPDSPFPPFPRG